MNVQNYELMEKIGQGSFALVYRAVEQNSKRNVAVKIVDLNFGDFEIENIQSEINTLLECKCNNIITYYQAFLQDSTMWIVMEYMEVGTLSEIIKMRTFKEHEIAVFCREIVSGLSYLHDCGIIHRDIKSANVLISASGDVKLSDFGFSRNFTNTKNKFDTFIGTPLWMAPEIIRESEYNYKVDIWSTGITCVEMATGYPPFHNLHVMKALFLIPLRDTPKLPISVFSTLIQQFIDLCLNKDPKDRPAASLLLKHPFLKKAKKKSVILPLIDKYLKIKKKKNQNGSVNHWQPQKPTNTFNFDLSIKKDIEDSGRIDHEDVIVDMESTITDQVRKTILTNLHKVNKTGDITKISDFENIESSTENQTEDFCTETDHFATENGKKEDSRDHLAENKNFSRLKEYVGDNIKRNLADNFSESVNKCLKKHINFLNDLSALVVHKINPNKQIRFSTIL